MGYAIKALCLLFVSALRAAGGDVAPREMAGLLLLIASYVFREKYADHLLLLVAEVLPVLLLSQADTVYLALLGVTAYDLAARGLHLWAALLAPAGIVFLDGAWEAGFLLLLAVSVCAGFLRRQLQAKESSFRDAYDRERQTRYALETTKAKLLNSLRETAHLAEIRERNRIAREIHDSVGHNLAGILLQLQAAVKVREKDGEKAHDLLQQSIDGLAASVELLRDTVYNIKPREQTGLAYFEKIIENYRFCPVNFTHSGDFAVLSPSQEEILSSILKEALTNAARHSGADLVEIRLEIRERIIRLYIKDNGVGCAKIREGLGISGMKERVRNAGGHITITPAGGFMIVCILPREEDGAGVGGVGAGVVESPGG